ncbi:2-oxo-tetronate isomerase [Methylovirgula sp. 4M-Z18]|uniref:2-oxo-tetronate isomerase n=1 Tax=Methylovirgula sp. 4M-Z18 TaxID=2293567 RepID=UPI000E2FBA60|nr:2-oxo-tetronate isomerase [Methylovirgula sp. 4M-Z18]RFB76547.1 hydroxypyruvate isomerase [Methylovirgula sp. 4M-Z18]
MIRFAANLSMMFTEWPFLDRFQAAADAGFGAVEYLFPYDFPAEAIQERLTKFRLMQAIFNLPPGDWPAGERGLAALPDRFAEFKDSVAKALHYAEATGVKSLHMMAGIADRHDPIATAQYRQSALFAAEQLATKGLTLLLEPINTRSMPGYFLNDFAFAESFIRSSNMENVKLQYDVFHRQILHGDVTASFQRLLPIIGHVQIASVPDRHEPDQGEINCDHFLSHLQTLGYDGFVGCEYIPAGQTCDGLGWFLPYRKH